jgi:serine/threonine protein kinase
VTAIELSASVVLAGKYRLAEKIGEGGMGIVHAGEHLELKTKVAIKLLQPKLAEDPTARARFLREARLAASIGGEHSTRIYDVGTHADGQPFMVMEFLAGESLGARLEREQQIPVVDAATVVVQLLDALAEAHARGLVHRDLKPANIFLVDKPGESVWVKVLDFGISKMEAGVNNSDQTDLALTEPRTLLGSPEYMSPEQLRDSANVDARADIWACGVILFELMTGSMPFAGASLPDLYARIVSHEPKTLSGAGESIPSPVVRMIQRCLRKDPEQRPQTVYELAVGLAPYASDSARALLPSIRARCKSELPLPDGPRSSRRVAGGITIVAIAGALAFAAASIRKPVEAGSVQTALPSARSVATLEPLPSVPPAPTNREARDPQPPVVPRSVAQASSSAATTPQASPPKTVEPSALPKPARSGNARRAPKDLEAIDLLE